MNNYMIGDYIKLINKTSLRISNFGVFINKQKNPNLGLCNFIQIRFWGIITNIISNKNYILGDTKVGRFRGTETNLGIISAYFWSTIPIFAVKKMT